MNELHSTSVAKSPIAVMFPGQGAQKPGMGWGLYQSRPEAREVFQQANEVLGFDLATLCFEGPAEVLTQTENAQPAILTVAVATWAVLDSLGIRAGVALGHSLGEYAALVCSGSLDFSTALGLVRKRGLYMAECSRAHPGAMSAVLGLSESEVLRIVAHTAQGRVLVCANFNDPIQVVISGEAEAVAEAGAAVQEAGARRVVPLAVSGAFHSPLMEEAAARLGEDLVRAPIADSAIPVIANCSGRPIQKAQEVRDSLHRQVASPVLWSQSVGRLREMGCLAAVEAGSARILTGMAKRIDPHLLLFEAHDWDSAVQTAEALRSLPTGAPELASARSEEGPPEAAEGG